MTLVSFPGLWQEHFSESVCTSLGVQNTASGVISGDLCCTLTCSVLKVPDDVLLDSHYLYP